MSASFPLSAIETAAPIVEQQVSDWRAAETAEDARIMAELVGASRRSPDPVTDGRPPDEPHPMGRIFNGVDWLEHTSLPVPVVWGAGSSVLWAAGEPLYICGVSGAGKSTLAMQLLEARVGIRSEVLGYPVAPTASRVLYLAMDRPNQAAKLFKRIYDPEDADIWRNRLRVQHGPTAIEIVREPHKLRIFAAENEADTIIIDSLKDLAPKLTDDEVGYGINRALQICVSDGVEVVALHHPRKGDKGSTKPDGLADMYGSTWLANGAGSVLFMVVEKSGDEAGELMHFKQPAEPVNMKFLHDHQTGRTTRERGQEWDPLAWLRHRGTPGSVSEAARAMTGRDATRAEMARARRILDRFVSDGLMAKDEAPIRGGMGGGSSGAVYSLVANDEP